MSGRASFEIAQKAWAACFAAVVTVSAPTALAVDTARAAGITRLGHIAPSSDIRPVHRGKHRHQRLGRILSKLSNQRFEQLASLHIGDRSPSKAPSPAEA